MAARNVTAKLLKPHRAANERSNRGGCARRGYMTDEPIMMDSRTS